MNSASGCEALAELLAGPRGRGLARYVEMQDSTPIVGKDHEHEQHSAHQSGPGEELHRDERV